MRAKLVQFVFLLLFYFPASKAQSFPDLSKKLIKGKYQVNSQEAKSTLLLFEDNTFLHYGSTRSKGKIRQLWYTSGKWLANKELVMCRTYPDTLNKGLLLDELKKNYPVEKKKRRTKDLPLLRLEYLNYVFLIEGDNLRDKSQNLLYTSSRYTY